MIENPSLESDLITLIKSFDKASSETDMSCCKDILTALQQLDLSKNMIEKYKLGRKISQFRKSCQENPNMLERDVITICSKLLGKWQKLFTESSPAPEPPSSSSSNNVLKLKIKKPSVQTSAVTLSPQRLKIIGLLKTALGVSLKEEPTLQSLATQIENEINMVHSETRQLKEYGNKARSLLHNIKKNEALRLNIISGEITPNQLIRLSPSELATTDIIKTRQQISQDDLEFRRLDWVEAHLEEIQKDNNLDPDNIWIYEQEPESDID